MCYYHCRFKSFCPTPRPALDWERPGAGQAALYMFLEAIVLFVVIILIEVRVLTLNTKRGQEATFSFYRSFLTDPTRQPEKKIHFKFQKFNYNQFLAIFPRHF